MTNHFLVYASGASKTNINSLNFFSSGLFSYCYEYFFMMLIDFLILFNSNGLLPRCLHIGTCDIAQ